VLILSGRCRDADMVAALRAGAAGYLLKDSGAHSVGHAIRAVRGGGRVLSSLVGERVLQLATGEPSALGQYDGLTRREVEVLRMVAIGVAYKQVARALRISPKTVRTHVSHIYDKLAIGDRAQVVRYALRKGLVEL
jgi:DNA-binding NarL/FixJ family response regulator